MKISRQSTSIWKTEDDDDYIKGRNVVEPKSLSNLCFCYYTVIRCYEDRRLADGNVHCAGSATYEICFRLPFQNPNLIPNHKP